MSPVTTIEVTVDGFPPMGFSHVSAAAAFAAAWRQYCHAYECTFREWMTKAKRRKIDNPAGVGAPIRVLGRNAWTLEPRQHSTKFVYDGESVAMCAHHSEIEDGHNDQG